MKTYTYYLPKIVLSSTLFFFVITIAHGQIKRTSPDSTNNLLNMDAVYDRPFLGAEKMPVAVGGYLEANSIYTIDEGVTEGLSFQARRMTLFLSASISKRVKFLSEIEFEDGTKEIAIEFAAMDIAFSPILNLRGGIIMNPIGAFNQNHDGPKWEFVERPTMGVNLLPATWSNVGFGILGKTHKNNWILGYEAYLTNGFDNSITDNEQNKTYLPAAKENPLRFEESSNGKPLFTGKVAIKNRKVGELGLSYMGGIYNQFIKDDVTLDHKRRLDVLALDFHTHIKATGTHITGEIATVLVNIPTSYTQQYGSKQVGYFIDLVQPLRKGRIMDWNHATINIAVRLDYVDWNVGEFKETSTSIGDQLIALTPALSFRPTSQTVLRLNYRYQWQKDILNNPAEKAASWYLGLSTYF